MKKVNKKLLIVYSLISVSALAGLYFCFGLSITSAKGLIFFFILLYASNSDIKTREVNDYIPLMIGITAFIGIDVNAIPYMLLGLVGVTLPQLLISVIKSNSYGGADIKIMAACSFLLGLKRGLIAIILGLFLAIVITCIICKVKKKSMKEKFAVVPYLALGSFVSFLLI